MRTCGTRLQQTSMVFHFQVSLLIKSKIALLKLLSLVLPLTIFIHYLEHREKKAILDYAGLLEIYRDDEKTRTIITNVIMQEIRPSMAHDGTDCGQAIVYREGQGSNTGDDGRHHRNTGTGHWFARGPCKHLSDRTDGLIAMIGGVIAEMSVSYISSKGHHDLNEGGNKELI